MDLLGVSVMQDEETCCAEQSRYPGDGTMKSLLTKIQQEESTES